MTDRCKQFLQDMALFVSAAFVVLLIAIALSGCATADPSAYPSKCSLDMKIKGEC